ncbi:hypothetical protein AQUCO_00600396v1 [Aquilegia coerulea]|uniref:Uncharacterized protein n=1 Tax=Aquilegia coerulea TaxID=218851 RepID=A0A2G5EPV0_AQUCA|nr:hypothetical protein AQUCO_00600396v1 [Aquilegia coerulea]
MIGIYLLQNKAHNCLDLVVRFHFLFSFLREVERPNKFINKGFVQEYQGTRCPSTRNKKKQTSYQKVQHHCWKKTI